MFKARGCCSGFFVLMMSGAMGALAGCGQSSAGSSETGGLGGGGAGGGSDGGGSGEATASTTGAAGLRDGDARAAGGRDSGDYAGDSAAADRDGGDRTADSSAADRDGGDHAADSSAADRDGGDHAADSAAADRDGGDRAADSSAADRDGGSHDGDSATDSSEATVPAWQIPAGCGDGVLVAPEQCDDGNNTPFDGCSSDCKSEPICTGVGPCTSKCGDGLLLDEECDDGNIADGDGCSSNCKIEAGFSCSQPLLGDVLFAPAIYRDFRFHVPTDFEPGVVGCHDASVGLVEIELDGEGKPVFTGKTGDCAHVESVSSFSEWYHDTPGINHATSGALALWNHGDGLYANRYGEHGERWEVTETASWCGMAGEELTDDAGKAIPCTYAKQSDTSQTDCQKEEAKGYARVPGSCKVVDGLYQASYVVATVDGTPFYFPVDGDSFSASQERYAQVPSEPAGLYDLTGTWPYDVDENGDARLHNFSFTSEIRSWFRYDANQTYTLTLAADNDGWIFINRKLAIDLGGFHAAAITSLTIDASMAAELGLLSSKTYEIAVFLAERQTTCSSLNLVLPAMNLAPSVCTRR